MASHNGIKKWISKHYTKENPYAVAGSYYNPNGSIKTSALEEKLSALRELRKILERPEGLKKEDLIAWDLEQDVIDRKNDAKFFAGVKNPTPKHYESLIQIEKLRIEKAKQKFKDLNNNEPYEHMEM